MTTKTKTLHPLRAVTDITETGRRGTEIGPHCFWLAREFVLALECNHSQTRVRDVYGSGHEKDYSKKAIIASFPKRVRCTECAGRTVEVKAPRAKPIPKHDPMALALGLTLARTDPDAEADTYRWISGQTGLAHTERVYADVAIALIDIFLPDIRSEHADAVRDRLDEWGSAPSAETAKVVADASRKLYHRQRRLERSGSNWHSIRGVIDARKATPESIIDAITWLGVGREEFYQHLHAARLEANITGDIEELRRVWTEEYPGVNVEHVPVLRHLIATYEESRARA